MLCNKRGFARCTQTGCKKDKKAQKAALRPHVTTLRAQLVHNFCGQDVLPIDCPSHASMLGKLIVTQHCCPSPHACSHRLAACTKF